MFSNFWALNSQSQLVKYIRKVSSTSNRTLRNCTHSNSELNSNALTSRKITDEKSAFVDWVFWKGEHGNPQVGIKNLETRLETSAYFWNIFKNFCVIASHSRFRFCFSTDLFFFVQTLHFVNMLGFLWSGVIRSWLLSCSSSTFLLLQFPIYRQTVPGSL